MEKVAGFCKDLKDSGLHSSPLQFTLQCALEAKKTSEYNEVDLKDYLILDYCLLKLQAFNSSLFYSSLFVCFCFNMVTLYNKVLSFFFFFYTFG